MRFVFPLDEKPKHILALRHADADESDLQRLADATESVLIFLNPGEDMDFAPLDVKQGESWE